MARNSLLCADVPLRNYSLTHYCLRGGQPSTNFNGSLLGLFVLDYGPTRVRRTIRDLATLTFEVMALVDDTGLRAPSVYQV